MKNHLFYIVISFLFVFCGNIDAQIKHDFNLKIKKSDFKTGQKEGLIEAWENLGIGDMYFDAGIGTYDQAREYYLLAHQYNPENSVLNFKIGICYLFTDDKYAALNYLRAAYDKAPDLHPEIQFYLGRAYHMVLEFSKAKDFYKQQRDIYILNGFVDGVMNVDKLIIECEDGTKLVSDPRRVIISNMGDSINSIADDYKVIFCDNDSTLYFTSRRQSGKKDKRNPYDNKYYENIFVSSLTSEGWSSATPLSKKMTKSKSNDAISGKSPLGNTLYIYRGNSNGGDIYYSDFNEKKSEWKSPKAMSSKLLSKQSEGSTFQTQSGDTLYFISSRKDKSKGGKDIFYSVKNSKGKWQEPQSLGSIINTSYDEEGIFLTPSGDELYFSSKGHNSMGGFDVFYSQRMDDGIWSDPVNMGYPVNTPDDEIFFVLSDNGKAAYYTTIRESVIGGKDIYKLIFLGAEKELLLSKEDQLLGMNETRKKGFFSIPEAVGIDSFYFLTGKVLDKKTGEPVFAKLEFIDVNASSTSLTTITNDSGIYTVKFAAAKNYGVEVVAKDYLFFLEVVDLTQADTDEASHVDFLLEKVEVGAKVVLENIYFETGKATLIAESYPQLNQIISFLVNNETVRLELSGHTDNVGSMKLNTKLSQDRAKAVVDYLVSNGITETRLEFKGYAYTQPIAPNDTPDGREKNRRVEFKILSK